MKPTFKIFLRSDFAKKDGSIPVYLRVLINRQKKDYSLGVSVFDPKKYWDEKYRQVRRCSWVDMNHINKTIEDAENRAGDIFRDMRNRNIPFTIKEFDLKFKNPISNKECFYTYAETQIERLEDPSPDTKRSYKSYINKMKRFRPQLTFGEITREFIIEYRNHLIADKNEVNTYNKALSWLKTQTKRARLDGLILNDPFEYIEIKKVPGKRDFLTLEELNALEVLFKANTLNRGEQRTLQVFLFSCFSGLRNNDARRLKMCDLVSEKYNGRDKTIIRMKQHKTKREVSIPLPEKAVALIGQRFKNQTVLDMPCNQVLNRHLKTISEKIGINKNLTFYVARHTFATGGLTLDFPIEAVSKLLGHTNLSTTMIYGRVLEQKKVEFQSRWDTYFVPPIVTPDQETDSCHPEDDDLNFFL